MNMKRICENKKQRSDVLYICSTYYHVLITVLKTFQTKESVDIVITHYIPDNENLFQRIKKSHLFQNEYLIGEIKEYVPKNSIDKFLNLHRKNRELIEQQLDVPILDYKEINIFHDDTWIAHYLQDTKTPYHLLEDSLDCFRFIDQSCFFYMANQHAVKQLMKKFLHYGYQYCGNSPYTISVEVNNKENLKISNKKIKVVCREQLFTNLQERQIEIINQIFNAGNIEQLVDYSILILTQPFYQDGLVDSEQKQIILYKQITKEFGKKGMTIYIKPHPRDMLDYKKFFLDAVILDKNMPVEILNINKKMESFQSVITVSSTAINNLCFTEKRIVLGNSYLKNI